MHEPHTPSRPLHIALACGGTGGHIFPGLATAEILMARGHQVTLWMAGKDIERAAVADWKGQVHTIKCKGFEGSLRHYPRILIRLLRAVGQCRRLMKTDVPDVLLAMGSYASVGPAMAARTLGVPVVAHEANVIPGKAIRLISRVATRVAGGFDETRHYLRKSDLVLTGIPLRREIVQAARAFTGPIPGHRPFHILSMGGSRGARAVNATVRRAVRALHKKQPDIFITHLTGADDEQEVRTCYEEAGVPHRVLAFSKDMAEIYPTIDLAICRAGAATCAELAAFGIPALLIPYPNAADNHQARNAEAMTRLGAADLVLEAQLETDWLIDYLEGCMHSPDRLARIAERVRRLGRADAAERLADVVEEAGRA